MPWPAPPFSSSERDAHSEPNDSDVPVKDSLSSQGLVELLTNPSPSILTQRLLMHICVCSAAYLHVHLNRNPIPDLSPLPPHPSLHPPPPPGLGTWFPALTVKASCDVFHRQTGNQRCRQTTSFSSPLCMPSPSLPPPLVPNLIYL